MEQLIEKLLKMGMDQLMDGSRHDLVMTDSAYLHDIADERIYEQRYENLDLPKDQRMLINDYIACSQTAGHFYAEISYKAGIKDAVNMLADLGLMRDFEIEEQQHLK